MVFLRNRHGVPRRDTGCNQRHERAELGLNALRSASRSCRSVAISSRISFVPRFSDMALQRLDRARCLLERLLGLRGRGLARGAHRQEPGEPRQGKESHRHDEQRQPQRKGLAEPSRDRGEGPPRGVVGDQDAGKGPETSCRSRPPFP